MAIQEMYNESLVKTKSYRQIEEYKTHNHVGHLASPSRQRHLVKVPVIDEDTFNTRFLPDEKLKFTLAPNIVVSQEAEL